MHTSRVLGILIAEDYRYTLTCKVTRVTIRDSYLALGGKRTFYTKVNAVGFNDSYPETLYEYVGGSSAVGRSRLLKMARHTPSPTQGFLPGSRSSMFVSRSSANRCSFSCGHHLVTPHMYKCLPDEQQWLFPSASQSETSLPGSILFSMYMTL